MACFNTGCYIGNMTFCAGVKCLDCRIVNLRVPDGVTVEAGSFERCTIDQLILGKGSVFPPGTNTIKQTVNADEATPIANVPCTVHF